MSSITVFQQPRALMIKNLRSGLPEVGKIKVGRKGVMRTSRAGNEFQPPEKLDHFLITTLERGEDGNYLRDERIHDIYGDRPTELPVRLLYNDPWLSFQSGYVAYWGRTRWCTGDGEVAQRLQKDGSYREVACPCPNLEPTYDATNGKCKPNGKLSVVIEGAEVVGGIWTLRTTSINSVNGISNSLDLLGAISGGWLAGVPLWLTLRPRTAQLPDGKTSQIFVVGIEFRGSMDLLRQHAEQRAQADLAYGGRMKEIESRQRLIAAPPGAGAEDDGELVEEFYPEAAVAAEGGKVTVVEREQPKKEQPAKSTKPKAEEKPKTAAPTNTLIEVWGADLEPRALPGGEIAAFVIDQLDEVTDLETLNEFLTANADHLSPAIEAKALKVRQGLEAYQESDGREGVEESKKDAGPPAEQQQKPADPPPASDPPPQQQAADDSLIPPPPAASEEEYPIVVMWPGHTVQNRYKTSDFPTNYARRKKGGPPSFEAEFRKLNPEVFAAHVPASLRSPAPAA